jgi:hypothetical protein
MLRRAARLRTNSGSRRRRRFRFAGTALAIALAAGASGACAGPGESRTAGGGASASAATVSKAAAAVLALHLRPADAATAQQTLETSEKFLDLFEKAVRNPGAGVPEELHGVTGEPAIQRIEQQVHNFQSTKLVARGSNDRNLKVLGVNEQGAFVTNCSDSESITIVHADTGKRAGYPDNGYAVFLFELRSDAGGWKVHTFSAFSERECLR